MSLTTDRQDPKLQELKPSGQQEAYLILSEEERLKGFVRPVRRSYKHSACGGVTTMAVPLAETFARDPSFYGGGYCAGCQDHFPNAELTWEPDGSVVGS